MALLMLLLKSFDLKTMEEAIDVCKRKIRPGFKIQILKEIIKVRKMEERYMASEIGMSTP